MYVVPGDWDVRPLMVTCRLRTSAAAGNRQLVLELRDDDSVPYGYAGSDVAVTENSTVRYAFQAGLGESMWPVDDVALIQLPSLYMWPTFELALRIVSADAGDQLDNVRLTVEKFTTARRRRRRSEPRPAAGTP